MRNQPQLGCVVCVSHQKAPCQVATDIILPSQTKIRILGVSTSHPFPPLPPLLSSALDSLPRKGCVRTPHAQAFSGILELGLGCFLGMVTFTLRSPTLSTSSIPDRPFHPPPTLIPRFPLNKIHLSPCSHYPLSLFAPAPPHSTNFPIPQPSPISLYDFLQ